LAKTFFAECQEKTLGKEALCRVPKKTLDKKEHSANRLALGKVPFSGSDCRITVNIVFSL
jgi:hypothetical protein